MFLDDAFQMECFLAVPMFEMLIFIHSMLRNSHKREVSYFAKPWKAKNIPCIER